MKPATPLPWNLLPSNASNLVHIEQENTGMQVCSIHKKRLADADYIYHACNAYPRLVAFVRVVSQNMGDKGATKQWMEDHAKILLRELGEIE